MREPDHEVAIIGAGPGGIAAAHLLQKRGFTDFVILERGDDFGGTWRDNHYPGLAVDIPTLWYQLSFAVNPDWSRLFAPGPEIYSYLRDTADRLGLYPHLRPRSEVTRQQWDDTAGLWRLTVDGGETVSVRFLISSVGGYVNAKPRVDIAGVDEFGGTILRPNAWDDDYDARGKRVAVIGTGSSGVQIAAALSGTAAGLEVYQRTPAWVLPKVDFDIPPLMRRFLRVPGVVPAINAAGRFAMDAFMIAPIVHVFSRLPDRVLTRAMPLYDAYCRALYRLLLRVVVRDPATRRALVPRYGILAKRPVISSSFLPALNDPHTHLVTTPIQRITASGVRTVDGVEHPADLLVLATGYELWTDPETYRPGTVLGADGFDLAEFYRAHGLSAYAGTAHPRLPNRWEIVGPLGFVGFAWPDFVETMAAHAVRVIDEARRRHRPVVAVSRQAFDRWNERMRRAGRVAHLYFTACNPGLNTYFVNSQRDTVYHRPQTIAGSRRFARRSPLTDYEFATRPAYAEELTA
ncbi:NAD(P)/FAD-dependent oxidoreductase [Mycolicibacterium sp. S2-37]|uniref:flavin-containing monooxygenase n=1 Tax=Mycolicibacterium sp. S2-37 TaxID=2810297 RepID=UPI001A94D15D|nr:NAD(P)/FAD-dependent oxidoreductase [Mycolicibacterium sp. S2-37]MBO0676590.1 NAD(P)/FAD-dependent oxidoreductase [Mycolicibacterium sp. S2-37]